MLESFDTPVELLVAGDGDDRPDAIDAVENLGIAESVTFAGHVPHSELGDLYRCSDVVVVPSWYEGFGNVVVEAQACGVPVVGSAVGGIPSLLCEDRGVLVNPQRPGELSEAIQRVLTNEQLARRLAERSREFVKENHSLAVVRDSYLDFLHRLSRR